MNRSLLLLLFAACSGDDRSLPAMPDAGPNRPPVDGPLHPVAGARGRDGFVLVTRPIAK